MFLLRSKVNNYWISSKSKTFEDAIFMIFSFCKTFKPPILFILLYY